VIQPEYDKEDEDEKKNATEAAEEKKAGIYINFFL
jgi:hypothetical protein